MNDTSLWAFDATEDTGIAYTWQLDYVHNVQHKCDWDSVTCDQETCANDATWTCFSEDEEHQSVEQFCGTHAAALLVNAEVDLDRSANL